MRPSYLGFNQVARICREWPELFEIDFSTLTVAGCAVGFAEDYGCFDPVLLQASGSACSVAAFPPFDNRPYDQRTGIVVFQPCRIIGWRWVGNNTIDLVGPRCRIPAEIAPQQGQDARRPCLL